MSTNPVIGILCLDISYKLNEKYNNKYESYFPASYVKFLESAGAKIIPIWIGKSKEFYRDLLGKINGVLLPGGALFFNETGGYAEAGTYIYEIACEMNESGNYFPILGICLGYELMLYISVNAGKNNIKKFEDPRQDCDNEDQCLPLQFKKELGKLFSTASCDIIEIFKNEAVTYNYHRYCVTEDDLEKYNLSNDWNVLSTNKDRKGLEYVSSVEHKRFPFYGLQFHPEKNAYEEMINCKSCQTYNAIKCSQYLSNYFVNECKKNINKFTNNEEKYYYMIYNYPVTFTRLKKSKFFQCYMFEKDVGYIKYE